ncbi:SDR family oxidoreductase [Conexibacter sp. JD483]|uniref:SDR family NAD(P)-dependent oxidoreductase n=1 Tax=unclassified Conexibacter TaxID=2627773 RepID=UPI00271C4D60|nr:MULTISPECIES: SDR family oxidoreductase [unclassified Conexibacter]MDO8187989.1 SDR family oxidoreductase [Conexibacter sp. CPCC 205706]MDO8200872.1 SDR family oxidoreductase [Conexibacter sp. CPCC 205762]MDR9370395.1 SDR family oxidoreductase [Conexibacter sp. JD483]
MGSSEIFAPGALDGQVALVTGGGTGLGRASAAELIACGARVVITGRRAEVLEATCARLGPAASWVVGDVRDDASAEAIVAEVLSRHGRLDLLVNNAGGQYFTPAEAIAARGWQAVQRLNVGGTTRMAELVVARAMRPAGRGTIVNVTLSPHHGLAGMTHSSAARAAVEGLTRAWAARWAADGIAVIAVAAGHFHTDALDKYPEQVRLGAARTVPLGRLGRPQEHGWLIALLASPLGRALSGSVVTLDGARDNWYGPWPPASLTDDDGEVPTEERRAAATR